MIIFSCYQIDKLLNPNSDVILILVFYQFVQIILVGHSMGGISISRAMELYPGKVLLAIYVAAVMPLDGDNFYNTLTTEVRSPNLEAHVQRQGRFQGTQDMFEYNVNSKNV